MKKLKKIIYNNLVKSMENDKEHFIKIVNGDKVEFMYRK